jgi:Rrf2 family cysteine metabolism transcriptional repressor
MNISVKGEYALQAIYDLASQESAEPVKIADIAKRQHIPQKFLELILGSLKQGGFVESRRGAEGGYLLARPSGQITIGEVLRFIEGSRTSKSSIRRPDSPFHDVWARADESVSRVLDRTTFADVVRSWREKQSRFVPNWEI